MSTLSGIIEIINETVKPESQTLFFRNWLSAKGYEYGVQTLDNGSLVFDIYGAAVVVELNGKLNLIEECEK